MGEYFVHILCDEEDIEGSPYVATILPPSDLHPNLVECSGTGLDSNKVLLVNEAAELTVDTRRAGGGLSPFQVHVHDATGSLVPVSITEQPNGISKCSYIPKKPGKHTVQVSYGGVETPKSPYRVNVSQPTNSKQVSVFGPGVEKGLVSGRPTHFNIDAAQAGPGQLALSITDQKKNSIPYQVQDNGDNTFTVCFCFFNKP